MAQIEKSSSFAAQAKIYFDKAYRMQQTGKIEEAVQLYKLSIELNPTPEAHTFLGWAYSHEGDYTKAIEECNRAIELEPGYGNPYNDIGAYLIYQGKHDRAEEWLRKAIAAPRYQSRQYAFFNLAWVLERQGKWVESLEEYQKALKADPKYSLASVAKLNLQARMN
ncbi:MAG: tetratricopeptide repeat protein [Bacteroidota bacterium]